MCSSLVEGEVGTGLLTGSCLDRTSGTQIPPLRRADRERAQGCPIPYTSAQDRQGSHRCCTEAKATGTAASSRCRGGRHQRLGSWNYQPSGPECCLEWEVKGGEEERRSDTECRAAQQSRLVGLWRGLYTPKVTEDPASLETTAWPDIYGKHRAN